MGNGRCSVADEEDGEVEGAMLVLTRRITSSIPFPDPGTGPCPDAVPGLVGPMTNENPCSLLSAVHAHDCE